VIDLELSDPSTLLFYIKHKNEWCFMQRQDDFSPRVLW